MKKIAILILLATVFVIPQNRWQGSYYYLFDDDGYTIVNAETQVWYDKVVTAGGTVSDETLTAVDVFFQQLADSSLRSKMLRVNLICGDGLASVKIPQILSDHKDSATMGYTIDSLMLWVSGDYTELSGLGNAANTTKYIKTGFNPSTISEIGLDNAGLGVYFLTNVAVTAGCGVLETNYFSLLIHQATNVSSARINATGGGNSASTTSLGYWDGNRTLSTYQDLYRNGVLFNHISRTSTAKTNQTKGCFFLANNVGGSPTGYDTRKLGCYTIHTGLNATEERALNNIIEHFQDKLGRGVQ